MAYVTNFERDIFVSYAHIDNEVLVDDSGRRQGWVHSVIDRVKRELRGRVGRELCVEMDDEFMRSNVPLSDQILGKVRSSAILLVVMSPSYVASEWCQRERNAFLSAIQGRSATGSLMLLRARPIPRNEQPSEFAELLGINFYEAVVGGAGHRLLGQPDLDEVPFSTQVARLCGELEEQLSRLRKQVVGKNVVPPTGAAVFVATATEDLEEREQELRAYLTQAGLNILPPSPSRYPVADLLSYETAVLRDLQECCLFAQVLSPTAGKSLEFAAGRRLPALQHELAVRAQKPIFQWRGRDVDPMAVANAEHRSLVESAQAWSIEEFKRSLLEYALHSPPKAESIRPQAKVVFVNVDAPDRDLAMQIGKALADRDVDAYCTPERGAPKDVRLAVEDHLRHCDGLVLVYGKTRVDWVQEQLRHARKINSFRDRPIPTLAIFEGPPPEKPEVNASIKNLVTLDCRQGIDAAKITEFVGWLTHGTL